MSDRLIFHIDVNSAFLSWEATNRLEHGEELDLRLIPSAIGGDQTKRHGVILAKSTPAKKFGIVTGEPIVSALKKCPHLVLAPPNFSLYATKSEQFIEILKNYSPDIEQVSIDEAFIDMTETIHLFGEPMTVASKIQEKIHSKLGFTVNIGISTNKLLAKMASDFEKPNKIHTLYPNEIQQKMWPLPVRELFFVGKSSAKKLNTLGIQTIGDLANTNITFLKSHLKKQGEVIYNYANGIDISHVFSNTVDNKCCGNSTTLPYDVDDFETAQTILLSLCELVCTRLRKEHKKATCITVHFTDIYFNSHSHQMTLHTPTNITDEVFFCAKRLFKTLWDGTIPIRLLGVQTGKITSDNTHQYSLFDMETYEKRSKLDSAIDTIRNKFGNNSITRACFLDNENRNLMKQEKTSNQNPSSNEINFIKESD